MGASSVRPRLLRWLLYGGSSKLRPYEERSLWDAFAAVSKGPWTVLESQLAKLDRVQRFNSDRQVNLFFSDDAPRVANRGEELSAARLKYRAKSGLLSVEIVVHDGLLSSIEFSREPERFQMEGAELVDSVRLADLIDAQPLRSDTNGTEEPKLRALLGAGLTFSEVRAPAPPPEIERLRDQIRRLPKDLELLLSLADGWQCRGWRFLGTRCRRIPRQAETLIAIAEGGERALCIGSETLRGWVLFDGITEAEEVLEDNLTRVLQKLLSAGHDV